MLFLTLKLTFLSVKKNHTGAATTKPNLILILEHGVYSADTVLNSQL